MFEVSFSLFHCLGQSIMAGLKHISHLITIAGWKKIISICSVKPGRPPLLSNFYHWFWCFILHVLHDTLYFIDFLQKLNLDYVCGIAVFLQYNVPATSELEDYKIRIFST